MPVNKKQLTRLIKLVAAMKEKRYPNAVSFSERLRKEDINENRNISCTAKTIQRDIRILKDDFNAPIDFDREKNGYYLKHSGWEFQCPALQDETMLAAVLGAKIAEDIMPEPVKGKIREAVEIQECVNNPDFMDTAFIRTLIIASGVKHEIAPCIFREVFEAWQKRHALEITYKGADGKISQRRIEPHVLAYYNSAWYVKAFCLSANEPRVFAVHRIISAEMTDKTFEPDEKIIKSVISGDLFDYAKIKSIEVNCHPEIAQYVREHKPGSCETQRENPDGSITLFIKEMRERDLIKWILSEAGNAQLIQPTNIAMKIAEAADKISKMHKIH